MAAVILAVAGRAEISKEYCQMTEQEKQALYEEAFLILDIIDSLLERARLNHEKAMQNETVK